ncbi:RES family NAD+ phosphorylase [Oceanobacillus sp. FSL K6-2867]|uniref:RES family NAD+ phosphorylase n=1 Tax=Oceanobacillus sp. FSL K6-2867 TaxID=2954748 RepID=UPI0030D99214
MTFKKENSDKYINKEFQAPVKALSSIESQIKKPDSTLKALSSIESQIKMPDSTLKALGGIGSQIKMPDSTLKALGGIGSQIKMPDSTLEAMSNIATEIQLKPLSSNWVLTSPVIKEMSLFNENLDANKIFSRIPREEYSLNQSYNNESNTLEFVLENKENKESIPLKDIPSTLAIIDILESLTIEDVFEFYRHLVKFPMLGVQHPVGERIFNEINKVILQTFEQIELYRVRGRNLNERALPYTDLEMFEAPHGVAGHGRFNVIGQGELYTCSSRNVALKEIAIESSDLRYDIIEWKLIQPVRLLDLSGYDSPLVQYTSFEMSTSNKQEYLIPNFLSQCVKFHGITGIRYKSIAESNATNYVFFDFEKRWFETINMEVDIGYKSDELQVTH